MIREIIKITTDEKMEFIDITDKVQKLVDKSKIKDCIVTIRTLHTTSAIFINENETGLLKDLKKFLSETFPEKNFYHHDDFSVREVDSRDLYKERRNGFAHLQAIILGSDAALSVVDGKLSLGTWQSIFFAELDGPRKDRNIEVLIYDKK